MRRKILKRDETETKAKAEAEAAAKARAEAKIKAEAEAKAKAEADAKRTEAYTVKCLVHATTPGPPDPLFALNYRLFIKLCHWLPKVPFFLKMAIFLRLKVPFYYLK